MYKKTDKKIGFFQNSNGENSSTKCMKVITIICIFFIWAYLCLKQNKFLDFPIGVIGVVGILVGGNTANKWIEFIGVKKKKD